MSKRRMFGRNSWRFSDAGNKFDGRQRPTRRDSGKPISPALKRGVIYCKRCGSRVVGNVNNCPFCGRPLKPVFARLWFWLIVVAAVALGVVAFINLNLPEESTSPSSPTNPTMPQVVGAAENSSIKSLKLDTTVDNSGLEVTAVLVEEGPLAANGAQIYKVEVEFYNTTDDAVTLYTTQWMLETSNKDRLDTFTGTTQDGSIITSDFETYELKGGGRYTGTLYFVIEQPAPLTEEQIAAGETQEVVSPQFILYQPSALSYDEELLVTWKIVVSPSVEDEEASETNAEDPVE